ncbi:MAG: hypothetical protein Q8J67_08470 [Rhodocyclaceae bacterium]|nr:hypothetical protein [Rhodocyclaceae bacterium]
MSTSADNVVARRAPRGWLVLGLGLNVAVGAAGILGVGLASNSVL